MSEEESKDLVYPDLYYDIGGGLFLLGFFHIMNMNVAKNLSYGEPAVSGFFVDQDGELQKDTMFLFTERRITIFLSEKQFHNQKLEPEEIVKNTGLGSPEAWAKIFAHGQDLFFVHELMGS